jgi:tetratricopeptide (TPR) repeat protein
MRVISTAAIFVCLLHAQTTADGVDAFRRGEYAKARAILEESDPADATARTFLALSRAATGSCDAVRPDLEQQFNSTSDAALRRLAGLALVQCALAQNRFSDAFPILQSLEKSHPGDPDVLYESARFHMKAWNDVVLQMYQKTPASFRVNQLSGEIFEIQGRFGEAAAEYRKAIQKNPAALNLHFRLGRALLLESHDPAKLAEARKEFEAELALNPSDSVAEYQIGQILAAEQHSAEAAQHFEKAVALNPEFAEALVALAKTRTEAHKDADAVPLLERAIRLQPTSESAHYSLMMAYRNTGRTEDAQREKAVFDKLTKPPEGEFTEFLKKLGDKPGKQ